MISYSSQMLALLKLICATDIDLFRQWIITFLKYTSGYKVRLKVLIRVPVIFLV